MKKMWSEEEVNAAIAEYGGTALYKHTVSIKLDGDEEEIICEVVSPKKDAFSASSDLLGTIVISGVDVYGNMIVSFRWYSADVHAFMGDGSSYLAELVEDSVTKW